MNRWLILVLAFLISLPACAGAAPDAPVIRDLSVFVDDTGQARVEDVAAAPESAFRRLSGSMLSAGYTRKTHWLRITLEAPAGEWWLEVFPAYLDDLKLYQPASGRQGGFSEQIAGDRLAFTARPIPHRNFIFSVHKDGHLPLTLYLRVQTTSASLVYLHLHDPKKFMQGMVPEYGVLLGALGALATVLLISLITLRTLSRQLIHSFVFYLVCLICMHLGINGFVAQYFTPEHPHVSDYWVGFVFLITISFAHAFYRNIFGITARRKWLYAYFKTGQWFSLALLWTVFSGHYVLVIPAVQVYSLATNLVSIWLALSFWKKGMAGGKAMLIANGVTLMGYSFNSLTHLGLLQGQSIVLYGPLLFSLGSSVAFYLALVSRLHELEAERINQQAASERMRREIASEKQARQEQRALFAMLSHEVKTPLAVIDGAVQTLEKISGDTSGIEIRHHRIRRAISRINELLEKSLQFDRVEHLFKSERKVQISLDELVASVVNEYALPESRLQLNRTASCSILGSWRLVEMLLTNLIENALKYSPAGTRVLVCLGRADDGSVTIDVANEGPAISSELRSRLFGRYVRGDGMGDKPGAGLGLYISRQIVDHHGGTIENVVVDEGVLFRVVFPS